MTSHVTLALQDEFVALKRMKANPGFFSDQALTSGLCVGGLVCHEPLSSLLSPWCQFRRSVGRLVLVIDFHYLASLAASIRVPSSRCRKPPYITAPAHARNARARAYIRELAHVSGSRDAGMSRDVRAVPPMPLKRTGCDNHGDNQRRENSLMALAPRGPDTYLVEGG